MIALLYATFPDWPTAERIAAQLVEEQLAACCNLLPAMQSIYRWEGAVQQAEEVAMLVKTTPSTAGAAMARIAALHPYENPAILRLPVEDAHPAFAAWVAAETKPR